MKEISEEKSLEKDKTTKDLQEIDEKGLEKTIENIFGEKLQEKFEKMIGLVIDKKIETILTDKQLTNHSNDSQSLERKNSLERKYDSDQDRSIDQIINVEQNERKEQIKRDEDFRTFSDKNSDKSHKGNRTRFSEIEEKFERKRPNFTHSIQKRKDSNVSEDYDTQPRKPTLPEIRKNTGSSRKETNPSYVMDQNRPLYSTLGRTPYFSVLSSLGLEEKDTDFIIKELSEYESMNKILHDNLKYQPAKYSPVYKKDKSLSIPKLYNVYLEKGSKQFTKKQIELNIRGSSPYLSGSKQKTPTNSQKLYYKPNYIKKDRSSSHGIKPRIVETNLSSDDEYNVTKHNTTSFLHNKKPKMSIELGLSVHKGQTRPASNLRKPPIQVNSAPKSKRSESYTPNVSARRISRTYIENSHKVTPIVSNLLKTNPAKKRPQAPSRYMDYLNERKTSSTLLANRSMISRNSGRASKAELISKAVMLNEPLSKIKDNPKRLATPSRSMSKEKVDSGRFIREKYRIRTSAQNEAR